MQAVDHLAAEHRLLSRVLDGLEQLLGDTMREDQLDGLLATNVLTWLERFADGSHQDKEERVLFPRLVARAPTSAGETVLGLLDTHESERELLTELHGVLEGASYGDALSLDLFVERGRAYLTLQRQHVEWEDRVLLPLAEEFLEAWEDVEMLDDFQRVEEGHGDDRSAAELADELCARLLPAPCGG